MAGNANRGESIPPSVIPKGLGFIFPVTGTVLAHGRPIHVQVSLAVAAM